MVVPGLEEIQGWRVMLEYVPLRPCQEKLLLLGTCRCRRSKCDTGGCVTVGICGGVDPQHERSRQAHANTAECPDATLRSLLHFV